MKNIYLIGLMLMVSFSGIAQQLEQVNSNYFEMRTYTANDGKMPDLVKRFQNHTMAIFERLGMENIIYWLPVDESDNTLTYILGYPDAKARDRMWQAFNNDPEWQKVYQESIENGRLVREVQEVFMIKAPGLNDHPIPSQSGIFQLRTYYCFDGKINDLQARFRNHTQNLFEKQGLKNYMYFLTVEKDGSQPKLVYFLGDSNQQAYETAFDNFRKDPEWIKARDASEKNGKIVEKVDAKFLKTLPFSPMK
jgi:hypothetical protein